MCLPPSHAAGHLSLALINTDPIAYQARGLYRVELQTGVLRLLTGLPSVRSYFRLTVLMAPDGRSLLFIDREVGQVLYAAAAAPAVYDVTTALGDSACCWQWLP